MSQARAIDNSYSNSLRALPLPGRADSATADTLRAQKAAADKESFINSADAARAITGQSQQTDFAFAIGKSSDKTAADVIAQLAQSIGRPFANSSGLGLSDEVVGFLLSANEVSDPPSSLASDPSGGSAFTAYQDVAGAFPRSQSSLFSLAA